MMSANKRAIPIPENLDVQLKKHLHSSKVAKKHCNIWKKPTMSNHDWQSSSRNCRTILDGFQVNTFTGFVQVLESDCLNLMYMVRTPPGKPWKNVTPEKFLEMSIHFVQAPGKSWQIKISHSINKYINKVMVEPILF